MFIKRVSILAVAASLVACASTQPQAQVSAPQPMQPVMVAPPPHPYALPQAPARVVTPAPSWYAKMPEDTADMMFSVGTATSTDEQMAYDKARMAAERKLIESLNSKIQTQTKSYRADRGEATIENYEQVTRKNANGELIGARRVDSQATFDGRVYKVYVLLRLPLGQANTLQRERDQQRLNREAELRSQRAHQDLERNSQAEEARQREADDRLRREIGPRADPLPMPAVKGPDTVPTSDGEVKLMQVDNEEYRRRRDEALAKPGAVIGNTTMR